MELDEHVIGICSWSLNPLDTGDLIAKVKQLELSHVHLDLTTLLKLDGPGRADAIAQLQECGIEVTSGMVTFTGEDYSSISIIRQTGGFVPDATWEQRRNLTVRCAGLANQAGVQKLSVHVGFIPDPGDNAYATLLKRVGEVAGRCAEYNVAFLMETGQESAERLLQFISDLPQRNVAINFDPANMILYGSGDPVQSARLLGTHIGHVHIKDATRSKRPGVDWGEEVPFGTGDVSVREFIAALHAAQFRGPLMIEREAGNDRFADVRTAIETLRRVL